MRIAWIQHVGFEGLGSIAAWAEANGHSLERVGPFASGFTAPGPHDLLVVMGGPMSACDDIPWLAEEKAFLAEAVRSDASVLGVCLGAQLVSEALGGAVTRNPEREIGWFDVQLTPEGERSAVLGALPARFDAFHWHGDTFSAPPGAVRCAESDACANQGFEWDGGRVVGVQFHLEVTEEGVRDLVEACGYELTPGPHVQAADALLAGPARFEAANARMALLLDAMVASR